MSSEGILLQTFNNVHRGLKTNGTMAINAANTRNAKDIEERVMDSATRAGFVHCDTWKLALSNPSMSKDKANFKYEPIFIFRKV